MGEKVESAYFDNDVNRKVLPGEKQHWFSFLMIFIGMWASLAAIGVGVDIGTRLTPWKAFSAIFLGYMICLVFGALVGEIGRKEGLSTAVLCTRPFSKYGMLLPSFIIFVVAGVFIGVQADMIVRIGMSMMGLPIGEGFSITRGLISAALCSLMMFSSYKGIKYIKAVSWVSVPVFLSVLIVALIIATSNYPGGISAVLTLEANEMSFSSIMFIGVSMYAGFSANMSDVSRFLRTRGDLLKALIIGYVVSTFIPFVGIILGAAQGGGEYWVFFTQLGLAFSVFAAIGLFLLQWTTNDNNAFTSGLALSTFFSTLHSWNENIPKITRKQATLVPAILGVILAFMGSGAVSWLYALTNTLGSWLVPLAGVLIAHYYIIEKGNKKIVTRGLSGITSMFIMGLLSQLMLLPYAAITSILGTIILYVMIYYFIEKPLFGETLFKDDEKTSEKITS